jgi:hypothetical protein
MALIRGGKSLFPCPTCLVPSDRLFDLSVKWPKRNQKETQKLVDNVLITNRGKLREVEEKLKDQGLRPIKVGFSLHMVCIYLVIASERLLGYQLFRSTQGFIMGSDAQLRAWPWWTL